MKIAIAGAGSVGRSIASELIAHGHDVTLIDNDPEAIHVSAVPEADWALCDACSPSALEDAGLRDSDVLVAATGDDKANLVISLLAKSEFAVPKVVARVNDPVNEWMFNSNWGVDVPTSTPRVMAALVEEAVSVGRAIRLFAFNEADVGVYALVIPDHSMLIGTNPADFDWPKGLIIASIIRGGDPLALDSITDIRPADELLVIVSHNNKAQIPILEKMADSH